MKNLVNYVAQTRKYGQTYIHSRVRSLQFGWIGIQVKIGGRDARITWGGWGRSLQSARGHKYKAWIRWEDTGKPVPSALLDQVEGGVL